jgi:hypothetical protein
MADRLNLLPDPRFAPLKAALQERVLAAAEALDQGNFASVLDPVMREVAREAFAAAGADEGTLWLADAAGEYLVPVHNTGPDADRFVGGFRQPLDRGMISTVFAVEQPFCENEVYRNERHDATLDRSLGVVTCGMIAVPFYLARRLRGILSCVRLKPSPDSPDPPHFTADELRRVELASHVLTRLLDARLLAVTVGWEAG